MNLKKLLEGLLGRGASLEKLNKPAADRPHEEISKWDDPFADFEKLPLRNEFKRSSLPPIDVIIELGSLGPRMPGKTGMGFNRGRDDMPGNPVEILMLLEALAMMDERGLGASAAPKTTEERRRWLEENFARVDVVPSGKDYVVAMPEGYQMEFGALSDREMQKMFIDEMLGIPGKRIKCSPNRIEATADSYDDGIGKLYNLVAGSGRANIYLPKEGQDQSVIVPGQEYLVIKHHDPLHDHASKDLIDFRIDEVDPYSGRVLKGSLDDAHSHLINPKLAL